MKFNIIIVKIIMLINGAMKFIKLNILNQILIVLTDVNAKNDRKN